MMLSTANFGSDISKAIDNVYNGGCVWALFSFVDGREILGLEAVGDDFEALAEEFYTDKIMYAYVRVIDPNSQLAKFVLIHWQGSGAPGREKFASIQHLSAIKRILKTVHITVNARSEFDLDWDDISNKVARSSGCNYSVHGEKPSVDRPFQPTKLSYKRTEPEHDPHLSGRKAFWIQQAKEEQEERMERGSNVVQNAMKNLSSSEHSQSKLGTLSVVPVAMKEASGVAKLRENFVQNHNSTTQSYRKINPSEEISRLRAGAVSALSQRNDIATSVTTQPSAKGTLSTNEEEHELCRETVSSQEVVNENELSGFFNSQLHVYDHEAVAEETTQQASTLTARALFDYKMNEDDEISLNVGDLIMDIDQVHEHWWIGTNSCGNRGMFPANHVELL